MDPLKFHGVDLATLSVRLPVKLVNRVYDEVIADHRRVSTVVFEALELWLEQRDQADSLPKTKKVPTNSEPKLKVSASVRDRP